MTIKKGKKIKGVQNKIMIMHNNFELFKKMVSAYNSNDYMLENINLEEYTLSIPGWEKSMFLQSIYNQSNDPYMTNWRPIIPNENTGSESYIETIEDKNGNFYLKYIINNTPMTHLTKKFNPQFKRI